MRAQFNAKSKTLWLQLLIALAAAFWPEGIEMLCSSDGKSFVITQCVLTSLAYVLRFRS